MAYLRLTACLRLIASKKRREYFANIVKNISELHSGISLKECDIDTYWKDSSQILIEATFSVSQPLPIDIWKKLFSQITKDYDISQDSGFFNFEHFESLDRLKSKDLSCFAVLNIPCGSVKEIQVNDIPCPKYVFKIKAGQTMPTLKLDSDSILYTCIPDEPENFEDEIEIWLDSCGEKICLFKYSLHYGLLGNGNSVIERCAIRNDEADTCFPKLFFDHFNKDRSWSNHLLADYKHNTMWLAKAPNGDMIIEIWRIGDPYDDNPVCEPKYSFTISYNDFMVWWNQLVAMDNLQ